MRGRVKETERGREREELGERGIKVGGKIEKNI